MSKFRDRFDLYFKNNSLRVVLINAGELVNTQAWRYLNYLPDLAFILMEGARMYVLDGWYLILGAKQLFLVFVVVHTSLTFFIIY